MLKGALVGNPVMGMSYFLYANDVILVSDWCNKDMEKIVHVLNYFYMASWLKLNINMPNLFGVGWITLKF